MSGIIYLMENKKQLLQAKFGHRTKDSEDEVIAEVNDLYGNDFKCIATYN